MTKLTISPKDPTETVVVEDEEGTQLPRAEDAGAGVVVEDKEDDEEEDLKELLPKRAVINEDGSVTLPLVESASITIRKDGQERKETFGALTFHRLKGIDLRLVTLEPTEMKRTIMALARSTRMSAARMNALFDNLDQRDVQGATDIIAYFQG